MGNFNLVNAASKATADAHYANVTDAHDLVNRLAGKMSVGEAAGGELSGTYPNPAILNSAILAKVLTGLNVVGSSIAATDNLLEAFGKLQSQLNGVLGGAVYQGVWDVSTNTPIISNGSGTKGHYYVVSVAGTRNLGSGSIQFSVGDWAIHNGIIYEKVDNTDAVSSVNGFIGAVNLTTADIPEVTNLYYTLTNFLTTTLSGFSVGANTPIADGISFATMLARIQGQITARATTNDLTNGLATKITKFTFVSKNVNYEPAAFEFVSYDTNAANRTVTPPSAPVTNDIFAVYLQTKTLAFTVTITGLDTLYTQGDLVQYQYNGSAWIKMVDRIQPLIAKISRTLAVQSITLNTNTVIQCDTVDFDPAGISTIGSFLITVPKTTYYYITAFTAFATVADQVNNQSHIIVNTAIVSVASDYASGSSTLKTYTNNKFLLNAGDTIQLGARSSATVNTNIAVGSIPFISIQEIK